MHHASRAVQRSGVPSRAVQCRQVARLLVNLQSCLPTRHVLMLLCPAAAPVVAPTVCASGWYGVTSFGTKQASCNQCPGTRPVSPEGARAVAECIACPEGQTPNEIFSECGEFEV
jgi:hypothetical protein